MKSVPVLSGAGDWLRVYPDGSWVGSTAAAMRPSTATVRAWAPSEIYSAALCPPESWTPWWWTSNTSEAARFPRRCSCCAKD